MSKVFWDELNLPGISINLNVGSGTQGYQTAQIIEKFENYLIRLNYKPNGIILYGDTNSTLAGALVGSKMSIPIIHIEAGLRSFNRSMPEEINRIVTDHLSTILFCSSDTGVKQLDKEGISKNVFEAGDVMHDACKTFSEVASKSINLEEVLPFSKEEQYCIMTLHRPSNTENASNLAQIISALESLKVNIIWPVHPRLKSTIKNINLSKKIYTVDPLSYFEMLVILKNCNKIFTDSGGLQKEAYWMKIPCITLRNETEWIETLKNEWNILCGADTNKIKESYVKHINQNTWSPLYTNGSASCFIARTLKELL
jgi:UDP-GlcNAc3NAcA epimerase